MKNLSIFFVLVFVGCGADTTTEQQDTFFETFYSDCVEKCATCEKWATNCDYNYDVNFCVVDHWDRGVNNVTCIEEKEKTNEMQTTNTCESEQDWICLSFQE